MQKRVLEVLKTWYFPYSAFWSAGQWGGAIAPLAPPPLATLLSTVRFFVMVRARYVGTLFELKIPDFSHFVKVFCMQRQKTADADAKRVN